MKTGPYSPIIGIDLGTTNSLVAYINDKNLPEVIDIQGLRLFPSVVSYADQKTDQKVVVGAQAKKNRVQSASQTVFSVKRLLGKGLADLSSLQKQVPYPLVFDEGEVKVQMGEGGQLKAISPIEISSQILARIKSHAEQALGVAITRAVITVPAYFNDAQRQATRIAAKLAGLEVARMINEPTAAALAYGLQSKRNGLIAVFDFGGGTFDLSILRLQDGVFEVLSTHGDTDLGGDHLDQALLNGIQSEIQNVFSPEVLESIQFKAMLYEEAERVKKELSSQSLAIFKIDVGSKTYQREIRIAEFHSWCKPVLNRLLKPCQQALQDAELSTSDLTDLILVGGPTRLQMIQDFAQSVFEIKPNTSMHPDEVVALGAAIQGDILSGRNQDLLLLDVTPLSLGMETYGGLMSVMIPRNSKVPTQAKETFTNFVDNQTGIDLHIVQGEREQVSENRSLARFKLSGLEAYPAGFHRIEVTFTVDTDGILQVKAQDLRTGKEQVIEVRPSFGLSDAKVEELLQSARVNEVQDENFKKWMSVYHKAEPVLRACEKSLVEAKSLLRQEEYSELEGICSQMRAAIEAKDAEKTQNLKYLLNQKSIGLAEKLIKATLNK